RLIYLARSGLGPGADCDARPGLDGGLQLWQLFDRDREVGVADQHQLAPAPSDALCQGATLAPVRSQEDASDVVVDGGGTLNQARSAVATPVVYEQQLERPSPTFQVRLRLPQRSRQAQHLLEARDNQAEFHTPQCEPP